MIKAVEDGQLPAYQTMGSAAADCFVRLMWGDFSLYPGQVVKVPLGFSLDLDTQSYALLLPRSSLGLQGITLVNSPGLIDSDYKLEVCALLINHGRDPYIIRNGDRVAQILLQGDLRKFPVKTLYKERTGGFGSSGLTAE